MTPIIYTMSGFKILICELLDVANIATDYMVNNLTVTAPCFVTIIILVIIVSIIYRQISVLFKILEQFANLAFSEIILLLRLMLHILLFSESLYFGFIYIKTVIKNVQGMNEPEQSHHEILKICYMFVEIIPVKVRIGFILLLSLYLSGKIRKKIMLVARCIQLGVLQLSTYLRIFFVSGVLINGALIIIHYLTSLLKLVLTLRISRIITLPLISFIKLFRTVSSLFTSLFRRPQRHANEYDVSQELINELFTQLEKENNKHEETMDGVLQLLETERNKHEEIMNDLRQELEKEREQHKKTNDMLQKLKEDGNKHEETIKDVLQQLEKERDKHEETMNDVLQQLEQERAKYETMNDVSKQLEKEREQQLCIVCQDRPKSMILLPCGHLCLCQQCSDFTESLSNNACPVCRNQIFTALQVFI